MRFYIKQKFSFCKVGNHIKVNEKQICLNCDLNDNSEQMYVLSLLFSQKFTRNVQFSQNSQFYWYTLESSMWQCQCPMRTSLFRFGGYVTESQLIITFMDLLWEPRARCDAVNGHCWVSLTLNSGQFCTHFRTHVRFQYHRSVRPVPEFMRRWAQFPLPNLPARHGDTYCRKSDTGSLRVGVHHQYHQVTYSNFQNKRMTCINV